jgi:hypothetical protein
MGHKGYLKAPEVAIARLKTTSLVIPAKAGTQ